MNSGVLAFAAGNADTVPNSPQAVGSDADNAVVEIAVYENAGRVEVPLAYVAHGPGSAEADSPQRAQRAQRAAEGRLRRPPARPALSRRSEKRGTAARDATVPLGRSPFFSQTASPSH